MGDHCETCGRELDTSGACPNDMAHGIRITNPFMLPAPVPATPAVDPRDAELTILRERLQAVEEERRAACEAVRDLTTAIVHAEQRAAGLEAALQAVASAEPVNRRADP